MRAHRGRPGPTVLLAGDGADLGDLEALIATLPADAYGQVYVEVGAADEVRPLPTPRRVHVTWLVRGADAAPGTLLCSAVEAWTAEWMPDGHRDDRRIAWVGCASAPRIAARYRRLQERSMSAAAMGLPVVDVDGAE